MLKRRVAIVIAAMTMLLLATSQVSEAHSRPIRFTPEPGSVVDAAPSSIQGWFSSDIRNTPQSFIQVIDSSKNRVDDGVLGLSRDRRNMSVGLRPDLPGGSYVVYWSTFDDADNEVFSGCYVFYVGQAAADQAIASGAPMDGGANCPANPSEANGATIDLKVEVSGSNATVQILPTNFEARSPDGTTHEYGKGHYHIYLDKTPIDALTGVGHTHDANGNEIPNSGGMDMGGDSSKDPNGLVENPVMWNTNSYTFKDIKPGVHTVAVALNYDDHQPYSPPVIASTNFVIDGAGGSSGGIETWMVIAGLGITAVVGLGAGRMLARG
jgi:methionine-rich copper-binding protein CopC